MSSSEAQMLHELTQNLGDDFWDYTLTPDPSPVKPKPSAKASDLLQTTPTKSTLIQSVAPALASTVYSATNHDITSFLEGSETWNLDDDPFTPIKSSRTQPLKKVLAPPYTPDPCTRCIGESVADEYVDNRWRKTIISKVEKTDECVIVYLYDDWYQTDVRMGDVFNVIGDFINVPSSSSKPTPTRSIAITAQAHLIIMHPDLLLTATALSTAPQCTRRPILSSMVRSSTDITPALVWGNILHEVMQRCLMDDQWDDAFLAQCVDRAVQGRLGDLVKIGLTEETAKREVLDRSRGLQLFAEKYLTQKPKPEGALTDTRAGFGDAPALLAITKLVDIEEDIWSPTYGIKGKLDATVSGIIANPKSFLSVVPNEDPVPFPLELKTGRAIAAMDHRAQTILYTLLVSERYATDTRDGLLFYTQSEGGEVVRVPRGWHEVRGLMNVRNELAGYMWRRVRKSKRDYKPDADMKEATQESPGVASTQSANLSVCIEGEVVEMEDEEPFLPAPIDDERVCKRCYVANTCMLFRKTHPNHVWPEPSPISNTSPQSSPGSPVKLTSKAEAKQRATFIPPVPAFMEDVFDAKTGHLTFLQTAFFRKWEKLLALEERDLVRFKRELWTLGAAEREKRGRCFGEMVIVSSRKGAPNTTDPTHPGEETWGADHKIHRHTYAFARSKNWLAHQSDATSTKAKHTPMKDTTLLSGHINIGDPVTVSVEPNMLALARGFVLELTPDEVVLGIDHQLDVPALQARLAREPTRVGQPALGGELVFRIDKDEMFGGMARVRNNLAHLFYADGDTRRLELVVDLRAPCFSDPTPPFAATAAPENSDILHTKKPLAPHLARLNPSQLAAMGKVLAAEDYALILGMPGTGKTTVIAALIRELVGRGKTVLLSSYTHSAVDTILMKLQGIWMDEAEVDEAGNLNLAGDGGRNKVDFGILRLGNVDKVHPDVRKYTLDSRRKATTVEQLEVQLMSPPVVATTCLSIEDPLFSRRHFDFCIVDEASQITLPTCLGPLRFADTFVLVGDHFQLPPLVKNNEARRGGLDVSLFRRLSEAHPEAVVDLRFQYRMNKEIMTLSNKLIYQDRLQCGNEEVANRHLKLGNDEFLKRLHRSHHSGSCDGSNDTSYTGGSACWLRKLADESCKAVFVDTDSLPAYDSRVGDLVQNTTEAELVRQLTETLIESGVRESQIGIITLYRQQVKVLQHLLPDRKGVEILTADKSQGRDKDCIIISLVRSNEAGLVGDLVKDWRRMNVSFTRARKKLVIFGSRKTLQREPLLSQFFALMDEKKWIITLPRGANTAHASVFDLCKLSTKRVNDHGHEDDLIREDDNSTVASIILNKENIDSELRPVKKLKGNAIVATTGVLNGRPILQDLVENET